MTLTDAIEHVLVLAGREFGSDSVSALSDEAAASRQAILEMEDLVVNHWESLEDRFFGVFDPDVAAASQVDPFWSEQPRSGIEGAAFAVLDLAARQAASVAVPVEEDQRAIAIVSSFWLTHAKDIAANMARFDLGAPS